MVSIGWLMNSRCRAVSLFDEEEGAVNKRGVEFPDGAGVDQHLPRLDELLFAFGLFSAVHDERGVINGNGHEVPLSLVLLPQLQGAQAEYQMPYS